MKKSPYLVAILLFLAALLLHVGNASAEDPFYHLSHLSAPVWEGTTASRLAAPRADYDYTYGDDESVTYALPWTLNFYGQNYTSITADTNGNIWFSANDAAYSVNLADTGRGPVISAWNEDLSSNYYGGVFIQHKSNPERVVIEWQAETYTEEGSDVLNNFEAVLFPDGTIRFDYKPFSTQTGGDAGSGISHGDNSAWTSLTDQYGSVVGLANQSFLFTPQSLVTVTVAKNGPGNGTVTSNPGGISCGSTCSGLFHQGANVVLSASPGFGSAFDSWSGACTGSGPCAITLDNSKDVTATFVGSYAPEIAITSPAGTTRNSTPLLNYAVSTGAVVVKVDGITVGKVSGDNLDTIPDGTHVLRVEATNAAGHLGYAESTFTVDSTPPAVSSITPADKSGNAPVRTSILVQFSEPIDPASVTAGSVSLTTGAVQVPGDIRLGADGRSLIFKPQDKLAYAAGYTFTLKSGTRDMTGNSRPDDMVTTFSTPMAGPDLSGYWPMDGDWHDYSTNANNGTAYGAASFSSGRVPGTSSGNFIIDSKAFDGSGGYVPTKQQFVDGYADTFTMSFWAKPTATRESTPEAISGVSGGGEQRFAIAPINFFNLGYLGATAGVSVGTNGISVFEETSGYFPSPLVYDSLTPLTGWNHITVVYNEKRPSLYVNGALVRTGMTSQAYEVYPSAVFGFGNERTTGSYSGQMEGVTYYSRALSADEVHALFVDQSRERPLVSISSPGQTVKYKPGETGSGSVTTSASTGLTKLFCVSTGAASGVEFVVNLDATQNAMTQQFTFQVAPDAAPYANYVLSCTAQTSEGVIGVGELALQVADVVPPTVVSSTPANNSLDVSATMPIFISFSEAIDPTSIVSRDTFKFQRADTGDWVSGWLRLSDDGKTLIAIPQPALAAATQYIITLNGVRDLAGNSLGNGYSLSFTTLEQTAVTIENKGTASSPVVLTPGRYGTLTINNSFVTVYGNLIADSMNIANSTLSVSPDGNGSPVNLSAENGDILLTGSQVTINGTVNASGNLSQTGGATNITGNVAVGGNVSMSKATLTLKSPMQVTGSILLQNNSTLTHFGATTTDSSKLDVTSGSMDIDATSRIDVSGKGYLGGYQRGIDPLTFRIFINCYDGPYVPYAALSGENSAPTGRTNGNTTNGGSTAKNGGSYGGLGGVTTNSANASYGDATNPNELGSGGGGEYYDLFTGSCDDYMYYSGGNGGGLIRLKTNALDLAGSILADGADADHGGGSGGGIRIDAKSISGTGSISARGGAATNTVNHYGGGGGGRIAIYYDVNMLALGNIAAAGGVSADGASASANGGPGTIFLKENAVTNPDLIIGSIGSGGFRSTKITLVPGGDYGTVAIVAGAAVFINDNFSTQVPLQLNNNTITVNGGSTLAGDLTLNNSTLWQSGALNVLGNVSLDNSSVTVSGTFSASNALTLTNNSVISHNAATTTAQNELDVTAGTVSIDATSKIDVTGEGYLGGFQGGNSATGRTLGNTTTGGSGGYAGGSYGGLGAFMSAAANAAYGSLSDPKELGSGGGGYTSFNNNYPGGNGGGLVRLAAGSLILNGGILANGSDSQLNWGGAGSGGGIRLDVGSLSGSGSISARGGSCGGNPSAGGGGRIAVYYNTNSLPTANITAWGGKSGNGSTAGSNGGAGTVYLKDNAKTNGDVIVDNGGIATTKTTVVSGGNYDLNVTGGALTSVAGDVSMGTDMTLSNCTLVISGGLTVPDLTLDNCSLTVSGAVNVAGLLTLKNNSVLSHSAATATSQYELDVTAGTVNIDATSKIDVTGKGYLGGYQAGNPTITGRTCGSVSGGACVNTTAGGSATSSGGSYGGLGAGTSNAGYGNLLDPKEPGSGGGGNSYTNYNGTITYLGGNGGGLVRLKADALILNGRILANGGNSDSQTNMGGAGSGGGIRLDVGSLSGIGSISAQGGTGWSNPSGGGGGRIAVYYNSNALATASISAAGGKTGNGSTSSNNGGAGTIYLKDNAKANGSVTVDNGGTATTKTTAVSGGTYDQLNVTGGALISLAGDVTMGTDMTLSNCTLAISGGLTVPDLTLDNCSVTVSGALNVAGLLTLKNNSVLSHSAATATSQYELDVTAGTVNIDATSKIDVTGKGYLGGYQADNPTITGRTCGSVSGGACVNTTTGGSATSSGGSYGGLGAGTSNAGYGNLLDPKEPGSGGGGNSYTNYNGTITYLGGNGGGLVRLKADALILNGRILANGGNSDSQTNMGGAGSGGGIRLDVGSLSGIGSISAQGGTGWSNPSGGGGGRIAVYYNSNALATASISAAGGKTGNGSTSSNNGGAGTIYLKDNAKANGNVTVDNGGTATTKTTAVSSGTYDQLNVTGGALISLAGDVSMGTDMTLSNCTLVISGGLTVPDLTLDNCSVTVSGALNVAGLLTLKNNSVLSHSAATATSQYELDVTAGTVNIDATSKIDVTGKGYLGGYQAGNPTITGRTCGSVSGGACVNTTAGGSATSSGGSYGGLGAGTSNAGYGNLLDPKEPGSGGGGNSYTNYNGTITYLGGNGGGLVRLKADALILNGRILANGGNSDSQTNMGGAGSGGGIRLDVGSLSGIGSISAQGGTGWSNPSGGGGGRIAVYYNSNALATASISAAGGKTGNGSTSSNNGGAGTIYLKDNAKANGNVTVDNGGTATTKTTAVSSGTYDQLNVTGGALISVAGDVSMGTDVTLSNATLAISGGYTVTGNLTLINSTLIPSGAVNVTGTLSLTNSTLNASGGVNVSGDVQMNQGHLNIAGVLNTVDNVGLKGNNLTMTSSTLSVSIGTVQLKQVNVSGSTIDTSNAVNVVGDLTIGSGSTVTVGGATNVTGAVTLSNGSTLSHKGATTFAVYKLDLTAASLTIDATSKIDVTGKGYLGGGQGGNTTDTGMTLGNTTSGGSGYYSGGSYGGLGGSSRWGYPVNVSYGSMQQPGELGSGGGGTASGNGGGLIKLTVGSLLVNGSIIADGTTVGSRAGGSGGGILINAGSITGTGLVSARGGSATDGSNYYGAGGGGRIAIYYGTNTLPTANVTATGGKSGTGSNTAFNGGPGTIYLKDNAKTKGDLIINNGGIACSNSTTVQGGNYELLNVQSAAIAMAGDVNTGGDFTLSSSTMVLTGGMTVPGNLVLTNSSLTVSGAINATGSVTLNNNSLLSHLGATTTAAYKLDVTAASVTIDATSRVDATGKGYLGGGQGGNTTDTGMTLGNTTSGGSGYYSGGSYGGLGGSSRWGYPVNVTYGSMQQPGELGSGGGGTASGNGGGLIKLTVGSLLVNGSIIADGTTVGSRAGGSGGGILINTGTISGTGQITARGGSATDSSNYYGAGGGGRIALYYGTNTLPTANISVAGGKSGTGTNTAFNGKDGTIYLSAQTTGLTVAKIGTGSGTITSSPAGISCGPNCSSQVAYYGTVTLTATPDSGSIFTGWTGACSGGATCSLTMDAAKTVTAIFSDTAPPVTVVSPAAGHFTSPQNVVLSCSDIGAGCDSTYYCLGSDCTPSISYAGPIAITKTQMVRYFSKDRAQNQEMVKESVYIIDMTASVAPASVSRSYQGTVALHISNLPVTGSDVLVEQFADTNNNGVIDTNEVLIRSFVVSDGVAPVNVNVQGDEDLASDGSVTTYLKYYLTSDLYHAPGMYLFRITSGSSVVTVPFVVVADSAYPQAVSGSVTDGTNPVAGAAVRIDDKWHRTIAYAITDVAGKYTFQVKDPGDYYLTPVAYGFGTPAAGTSISVLTGQTIDAGTIALNTGALHITGQLNDDATGTGIAGVWIEAKGSSFSGVALTGNDGSYDLKLPADTYAVAATSDINGPTPFSKGYVAYGNQPIIVNLSGDTAAHNIALPKGGFLVSGQVTDQSGLPLAGMPVQGRIWNSVDSREPVYVGVTDANGNYTLNLFGSDHWNILPGGAAEQVQGDLGAIIRDFSTNTGPLNGNNLTASQITN